MKRDYIETDALTERCRTKTISHLSSAAELIRNICPSAAAHFATTSVSDLSFECLLTIVQASMTNNNQRSSDLSNNVVCSRCLMKLSHVQNVGSSEVSQASNGLIY